MKAPKAPTLDCCNNFRLGSVNRCVIASITACTNCFLLMPALPSVSNAIPSERGMCFILKFNAQSKGGLEAVPRTAHFCHFFLLRSDAKSRGHPYRLFLPGCSSTARHNYFTHRVARAWNNLPENSTNFSSLALFKRSLSSNILARYCKIYYF